MKAEQAVVRDIVTACRHIADFLREVASEEFMESVFIQSAVIRQLEIIGEAARRLSSGFRETHGTLPWKDIVGMRDRLIHGYDDVDLDVVWEAATQEVPLLLSYLADYAGDADAIQNPEDSERT